MTTDELDVLTAGGQRDRRAVARLEARLRPADAACDKYGLFFLSDSPRPWSRTTVLGRLIEFGPMGASQPGVSVINVPPLVMLVDRCYATFSPLRQKVFLTVYAWRRTESREIQMRYARISLATYNREKTGILECVTQALALEDEKALRHVTVCA
jgi:hypothetical protein